MFPEEYTDFIQKQNAIYDGDPNGDYVLAEHINELQDAVNRVEIAIGLVPDQEDSLAQRLQRLEKLQPLRVPAIGYFTGELGSNASHLTSILSSYALVILNEKTATVSESIPFVKERSIPVYGQVMAGTDLAAIQTLIQEWRTIGADGIFLKGLGEQAAHTRSFEQNVFNSVTQSGLKLFVSTLNWQPWLNNETVAIYNPNGAALTFPEDTLFAYRPFAYDGRLYTSTELQTTIGPNLQALRAKGLRLAGFGHAPDQSSYNYLQAAGLLFGLDYLANAPEAGTSLSAREPFYDWPGQLADWKTDEPVIFQETGGLYRNIPNGRIRIQDDGKITLEGYTLNPDDINWTDGSVPGSAIKDASITPAKLTTYDIAKIVELLNATTDENIRILSNKISADEGGAGLPINIPASNMLQNVIEAINRKNIMGQVSKTQIADAAIESLSASKLTGSIPLEVLQTYVVPAINASATDINKISVPRMDIVNLTSTGTVDTVTLSADNLTVRAVNVTASLAVPDLTISNYVTGNDGEFLKLYVEQLEVESLTGLESLHLKTLTADNIGTLVIDAINANITNGTFNNIVTEALTATTIQTELITAVNAVVGASITNTALFGNAVITDASIKDLSATKLMAGTIDTGVINISSPDGHLKIEDRTIRIYDSADAQEVRRLRVQMGDISEWSSAETPADYGLIVFGQDGTTRLYDHTGVYNAGIKENAISEAKIQEDAISSRVIAAGAIITEHLTANVIQAENIAADQILAEHILAETITGTKIAGDTIEGRSIKAGSIEAGHIQAGQIDAGHIKAGAITADRLAIGFSSNLIKRGYDSFEQEELGTFEGIILEGETTGIITDAWSFDGEKSLFIQGNTDNNRVRLDKIASEYSIPVMPGLSYMVSVYAKTISVNQVPLRLGMALNDGTFLWSSLKPLTKADRLTRLYEPFLIPTGVLRASVTLAVDATNVGVYFDCIQVEEMSEGQTEPGFWKSTATTTINGNNITTGRVNADRIHIGGGTVFGTNNDIIDITDAGIKAKSSTGWAMLNSKGLEIVGGAFKLSSINVDGTSVNIDGESGITVETPANRIEMDAANGFRIISKENQRIMFDVDPTSGQVRMSGSLIVYDDNNPLMQWTMDEKITQVELDVSTQNANLTQAQEDLEYAQGKISEIENNVVYKVEVHSSNGLIFQNGNIQTEIYAIVYKGAQDITSLLPPEAFVWKKNLSNGTEDLVWKAENPLPGQSFVLTGADVIGRSNFTCYIDIVL